MPNAATAIVSIQHEMTATLKARRTKTHRFRDEGCADPWRWRKEAAMREIAQIRNRAELTPQIEARYREQRHEQGQRPAEMARA